jgi:uncharacterized protein YukE
MSILGSIFNFSKVAAQLAQKIIDVQKNAIRQMIAVPIQAMLSAVVDGKWKGKGADAFKREMTDVVLKQLQNMGGSLDILGGNIRKAAAIMENCENQVTGMAQQLGNLFSEI